MTTASFLVDDPKVRDGFDPCAEGLHRYIYQRLHAAVLTTWKDPDNKTSPSTQQDDRDDHNFTISIARNGSRIFPQPGVDARTARGRKRPMKKTSSPRPFPNRRMVRRTNTIRRQDRRDLRGGKNKAKAKEFVSFRCKKKTSGPIRRRAGRCFSRRRLPGQRGPFWQADRHRKAVYNQFTGGTQPFDFNKNYKFTILNNENVWAKAMKRVVSEKVPVDKAVDE